MPAAYKSYWNDNVMVVLFLDIDALCTGADSYLDENFYLFDAGGALLYNALEEPAVQTLPLRDEALFQEQDGSYVARRISALGNLTGIKLLPKNAVVGQVTQNLYVSLAAALLALADGLQDTMAAVETLRQVWLRLWNASNKPQGFEVIDGRLGGVRARLDTARRRAQAYATGENETLDDLREPALPCLRAPRRRPAWPTEGEGHSVCLQD